MTWDSNFRQKRRDKLLFELVILKFIPEILLGLGRLVSEHSLLRFKKSVLGKLIIKTIYIGELESILKSVAQENYF